MGIGDGIHNKTKLPDQKIKGKLTYKSPHNALTNVHVPKLWGSPIAI